MMEIVPCSQFQFYGRVNGCVGVAVAGMRMPFQPPPPSRAASRNSTPMSSSADSVSLSSRYLCLSKVTDFWIFCLVRYHIRHSTASFAIPSRPVLSPPDRAVKSASQNVSPPRGKGTIHEDYLRAPPSNSCSSLIIWESASPIGYCFEYHTTGPTLDLL